MVQLVQVQRDGVEDSQPTIVENVGDKQLIKQINEGDPAALEILYERYAPAITGLALKMLGDRTTAEEIVQETFWRVWKSASTFRTQSGTVSSWLFGITRNMCIDTWRRNKTRPQPVLEYESDTQSYEGADPEANVAELVFTEIRHSHVKVAIDVLPPAQRRVIELAYFWGMTRQEIAKTLNIPLGTVHTRARLALRKLRETLISQGFEDQNG